jgi:hypothetical protein
MTNMAIGKARKMRLHTLKTVRYTIELILEAREPMKPSGLRLSVVSDIWAKLKKKKENCC